MAEVSASTYGENVPPFAKPRISLCMIVRDEAETLPHCLDSVSGLVDEIVVVDTGSADHTPAVAAGYGARITRIPWPGSFAAARNTALDLATGDWILVLDADERIDPADRPRLRTLVERREVEGYLVRIINHFDLGDRVPPELHSAVRLFRNQSDYRFIGTVHEQPTVPGPVPADVRVHHWGYLPEVYSVRGKAARNEALLQEALSRDPQDPYLLYSLAVLYSATDRFAEARRLLTGLVGRVDPAAPYHARLLKTAAQAEAKAGTPEAALAVLDAAIHRYPDYIDLYYLRAGLRPITGDWDGALEDICRCLESGDAPPGYDGHQGVGGTMALKRLDAWLEGAPSGWRNRGAMRRRTLEALLRAAGRARAAGAPGEARALLEAGCRIGPRIKSGAAEASGRLLAELAKTLVEQGWAELDNGIRACPWSEAPGRAKRGATTAYPTAVPLPVDDRIPAGPDSLSASVLDLYRDTIDALEPTLPSAAEARLRAALALALIGVTHEALAELQAAETRHPDYTDLHFLKGVLYRQTGNLPAARASFEQCLRLGRSPPGLLSLPGTGSFLAATLLGESLLGMGSPRAASAAFSRALASEPRFLPAWTGRARSQMVMTGDQSRARLTEEVAPDGSLGLSEDLLLGRVWLGVDRPAWALPHLLRAWAAAVSDPAVAAASASLAARLAGLAYLLVGRPREAARLLAYDPTPGDPVDSGAPAIAGQDALVVALLRDGRTEEARSAAAADTSPIRSTMLVGLIDTWTTPGLIGHHRAARRTRRVLRQLRSEAPQSYQRVGLALIHLAARLGDPGLLQACGKLLSGTVDPQALAWTYLAAGHLDLAGPILARTGTDATAEVVVGAWRLASGDPAQAETVLRRAVAGNPQCWPAWIWLWSCLGQQALTKGREALRLIGNRVEAETLRDTLDRARLAAAWGGTERQLGTL